MELLVDVGKMANEGKPLFVIETEKVETEIDAALFGTCIRHRCRDWHNIGAVKTSMGAIHGIRDHRKWRRALLVLDGFDYANTLVCSLRQRYSRATALAA
jgi:hypothetical protein